MSKATKPKRPRKPKKSRETKESKAWDATVKQLVKLDPSAIDTWVLPGAQFVEARPLKARYYTREADVLHEVIYDGQHILLHIEFQTYNDTTMPDRLLMYNVLLTTEFKMPVLSCVIYLLRDGKVYPSPLERSLSGGQHILTFHYQSLEIGRMNAQDLLNRGVPTLLALIPLTRNGTQRATIEMMFRELQQKKPQDEQGLVSDHEAFAFTFTSYILDQTGTVEDQEWFKRRFREMYEALENTSLYREIMQRVLNKGVKQGLEQGLEQGRIASSRHSIQLLTKSRFPALSAFAQEKVAGIDDLELLDVMLVGISAAHTEEEALAILQRSSTSKTE